MTTSSAAGEGITVAEQNGEILLEVRRVDSSRIDIKPHGFVDHLKTLNGDDTFLVIDKNIYEIYTLKNVLLGDNFYIFDSKEENKNLYEVKRIIDQLYSQGVHRRFSLTSVGGGIASDVTGVVANLYFRGVNFNIIPTTLLSMVDAAIGGKIGVNHEKQKNLIGGFYHPSKISMFLDVLETLPNADFKSAFGEIIKIAIICDTRLFEQLEARNYLFEEKIKLDVIIKTCVTRKLELLGENCFERDLSRILNFGHSIAHPLEDITDFKIKHGYAVGIGIYVASHISLSRGILSHNDFQRITAVLKKYDLLSLSIPFDFDGLWMMVEKLIMQRGGKSLLYVIPSKIGEAIVIDYITKVELYNAVNSIDARKIEV